MKQNRLFFDSSLNSWHTKVQCMDLESYNDCYTETIVIHLTVFRMKTSPGNRVTRHTIVQQKRIKAIATTKSQRDHYSWEW